MKPSGVIHDLLIKNRIKEKESQETATHNFFIVNAIKKINQDIYYLKNESKNEWNTAQFMTVMDNDYL